MKKYFITDSTPLADGYYMPAEFMPHQASILIWPERAGSWPNKAAAARKAFAEVIKAIAKHEKVYVASGEQAVSSAVELLFCGCEIVRTVNNGWRLSEAACSVMKEDITQQWRCNIEIFPAQTDDAWARDIAPTFLIGQKIAAKDSLQEPDCHDVRGVNWEFNAWGGSIDGLYASWEKDNAFAVSFAQKYGFPIYNASPFVLEGGAVHSDGEGTLLVTKSCLLSRGRNPELSQSQIEERLKQYLGAQKVLWLPRGIYMDETNEHVDNVCAFVRPAEVALAWTENKSDPQYELSMEDYEYLRRERDAKGRQIIVHKLPIPDVPVCVQEEELEGYDFEEGEDQREAGERLAASYVNFYYANRAVILPAFGGENEASDKRAAQIMRRLHPDREIISVYARDIMAGGGNIHCITQQIPV